MKLKIFQFGQIWILSIAIITLYYYQSYQVSAMKSIKNFFPTVGGSISNKRQRLTETTFAALSNVAESEGTSAVDKPVEERATSPLKGPQGHQDSGESVAQVPHLGWVPFDEMEISWKSRLFPEYNKPYFQRLLKFLDREYKSSTIFPPTNQIFTSLNLCPYDKVKVVIIGQDPYHGPGQAHGLAFSVQKGVPIPPSLKNMIVEAQNDVHIAKPTHGNLEHWSRQGVLLLNTCLTVRKGEANSHQKQG